MKKMNNKGFSLVELIIVIAIMAILIGVLAPQYIKYVEKSRVSADKDTLDGVYNACTTASADPELSAPTSDSASNPTSLDSDWGSEVLDTLGVSDFSAIVSKIKSKSGDKGSSGITISADAKGNITVWAGELTVPEN